MNLKRLQNCSERVNGLGQILFMVGLATTMAMLVIFACDRAEPFNLMYYSAPPVHAGEILHINAVVRRDLNRECAVTYTRSMVDAKGTRFWESQAMTANSESIREMDVRARNELNLEVQIPVWAPVGKITYVTSLDYECNPIQRIWPIMMTMLIESEVLQSEVYPTIRGSK